MKKIARLVVNHKLTIVIVFAVLTVVSVVCIPFVEINYNDIEYLPNDNSIKIGLNAMCGDFGGGGNSTMMVHDVSIADMVNMNKDLEKIDGVDNVVWIDDLLLANIDPADFADEIPEDLKPLVELYLGEDGGNIADVLGKPEDKVVVMVLDILSLIMSIPIESRSSVSVLESYIETNQTVLDRNSAAEYSDRWPGYAAEFKSFYKMAIMIFQNIPDFDSFDLTQIDMIASQLDGFYKKNQNNVGYALVQISFTSSDHEKSTQLAIDKIKEYMSERNYEISLSGNAAVVYFSVKMFAKETVNAMILAAIVVIIVLLLTTSSYWEPILLIIPMGISIALNMGSNIFMPNISYMTNSIASILQLALTMDYSIYLLNRFKQEKNRGLSSKDAMAEALTNSVTAISSASLTTVASFVALMFMKYKLGLDMGLVLAKGVIFSMISVFLVLPVLTLYTEKLIEKTAHKTFNFSFRKLSQKLLKHRIWMPIVLIALIAIGTVFQAQNTFVYGQDASIGSEGTDMAIDKREIENIFGKQNQGLILLSHMMFDEDGDGHISDAEKQLFNEREILLSNEMLSIPGVKSVQGWALIEDAGASKMLPDSFKSQFAGEYYNRLIFYLDLPEEGEETTTTINKINSVVEEIYRDKIELSRETPHHLGNSAATLEIKNLVNSDYDIITYISIVLVGLIVLLAFKSLIIPVILIVVIQGAIFINMAIPYFQQSPLVFVGYMLVSSILLGATIDYAIVVSSHYMEHRVKMNKYNAIQHAIADSARTLMTSAGIFTFAGLVLSMTTSSSVTGVFGQAIFRGGILSFVFVLTLLPQLLVIFDGLIRKTTWKGKKLMMDNRLSMFAPDVAESVVLPTRTVKKKRLSQIEREQEIINAIIAGIEKHSIYIEKEEPISSATDDELLFSKEDGQDFMEEPIMLFDEEEKPISQTGASKKNLDFSPNEGRNEEGYKKLPDINPLPPVDDDNE